MSKLGGEGHFRLSVKFCHCRFAWMPIHEQDWQRHKWAPGRCLDGPEERKGGGRTWSVMNISINWLMDRPSVDMWWCIWKEWLITRTYLAWLVSDGLSERVSNWARCLQRWSPWFGWSLPHPVFGSPLSSPPDGFGWIWRQRFCVKCVVVCKKEMVNEKINYQTDWLWVNTCCVLLGWGM